MEKLIKEIKQLNDKVDELASAVYALTDALIEHEDDIIEFAKDFPVDDQECH